MRCKCDGCGAWKGEANGWLLGAYADAHGDASLPRVLGFCRWDDRVAKLDGVMHLCGEMCMQKMLSEHLAETPVAEKPAAAPEPPPAPDAQTYEPIECEYCGTHCYGGAEHIARVESGDRYSDGGEI